MAGFLDNLGSELQSLFQSGFQDYQQVQNQGTFGGSGGTTILLLVGGVILLILLLRK